LRSPKELFVEPLETLLHLETYRMLWRMLQHLAYASALGQEIGVGHLREILVGGHLVSRGRGFLAFRCRFGGGG
jgi:hypothetical protein